MKVGLLADSHGRQRTTAAAVAALLERGAVMLVHLGDFQTIDVLDELVGRNARGVLGNCDTPKILSYAHHVGVDLEPVSFEMTIGGKRLVATHGHVESAMQAALESGADYLFHGHTHELRDEMVDETRIVNPGALAHANRYTAAVLDTERGELDVIEIPGGLD